LKALCRDDLVIEGAQIHPVAGPCVEVVACGDGAVRIVELQKAGGRPMKAEEFLRGTPVRSGAALG